MHQQSLFADPFKPQSVDLFPDFITEEEESEYLKLFETIAWQKVEMHGVIAKRRVAYYGLDYTYTQRSVRKTEPPPQWLNPLITRSAKVLDKSPADLEEVLVTYYPKGSGIGWHRDAEVFGDAVIGISFFSDCVMKFKNPADKRVYKFSIPRRSAYVFAGEARWQWLHSILTHSEDRYSITFRTLKDKKT